MVGVVIKFLLCITESQKEESKSKVLQGCTTLSDMKNFSEEKVNNDVTVAGKVSSGGHVIDKQNGLNWKRPEKSPTSKPPRMGKNATH